MTRTPYHKKRQTLDMDDMDKALEKRPPRIVWKHNGRGIQVAVLVEDPHAETSVPGRGRKAQADPVEPYLEYVDLEPAVCMDESLLSAARAEI